MKTLLAVMAVLVVSATQAEAGKIWVDEACGVMIEGGENLTFSVATMDNRYENTCQVVDWPISSPIATIECADRATAYMQLDGDGVMQWEGLPVFRSGGLILYPKGDDRIRCD